jgi:hypothetical protein
MGQQTIVMDTDSGPMTVVLSTDPYSEDGIMEFMAKACIATKQLTTASYPEQFLNNGVLFDLCKAYTPVNKTVYMGTSTSGELPTSVSLTSSYYSSAPSSGVAVSSSVTTSGY